MTGLALRMAELQRKGVRFDLDQGRVAVTAPAGIVTTADQTALRSQRAEVLALLTEAAGMEADGTADRLRALYAALSDTEKARLSEEARSDQVAARLLLVIEGTAPAADVTHDGYGVADGPEALGRLLDANAAFSSARVLPPGGM